MWIKGVLRNAGSHKAETEDREPSSKTGVNVKYFSFY